MTLLILIITVIALYETIESWYYRNQVKRWKQNYKNLDRAYKEYLKSLIQAHREKMNPDIYDKDQEQVA